MLKGIKIIDFSRYFPGPYGTARLRDMGAEVIKIEDPNGGDLCRFTDKVDGAEGANFRVFNWGKKSVAKDMKSEVDREYVIKLISQADVLIESFRPGVAKRLGIDYESMSRINPRLVYVSVSGYGQNSHLAHLGGHDPNYLAMSGVLDMLKDKDGRPISPQLTIADLMAGVVTSECVLAGLVQVQREGKGKYFDLSMTEAVMSLVSAHVTWASLHDYPYTLCPCICNSIYETSDGRYITLAAAEPKFFANFCKAVGREDLIEHQFSPNKDSNAKHQEMVSIFKSRSFEEWSEFAVAVDCCMAPVLHPGELAGAKHVTERGMIENRWGMDILRPFYSVPSQLEKADGAYPILGANNADFE